MEQPPEHKMSSEGAEGRPGESLIVAWFKYNLHLTVLQHYFNLWYYLNLFVIKHINKTTYNYFILFQGFWLGQVKKQNKNKHNHYIIAGLKTRQLFIYRDI